MDEDAIRKAQGARLAAARLAAGFKSARAAALQRDWAESTYRAHEGGRRTIGQDDAEKYAKAFRVLGVDVTASYILFGDEAKRQSNGSIGNSVKGSKGLDLARSGSAHTVEHEVLPMLRPAERPIAVPVRGETAAGLWFEHEQMIDEEPEPIPTIPGRYANLEQFAYRVSGNSMNKKRIHHGDHIICVPYFDVRREPTSGDIAVIERKRGQLIERSCKEIQVVENGYELWPRSTDKLFQEPIRVRDGRSPDADDGTEIEIIGLVIAIHVPV